METEFEAKFYPVNKEEYRELLKKVGAELVIPERKMRRTMVDKRSCSSLKCDYIRVRDEGNLVRLSAKIHADENGKISDQREVDVEVNSYDKTVEIIELAGLKLNRYQETLRETWKYKGAEITIDTWPCLEPFSEIEAQSEKKVREIAEDFGFDWNQRIITATPELIAKVYNLDIEEVLDKVSNITFENNPFEGMKRND